MTVIRDTDTNGLLMIPLWNRYNLHPCNVENCTEKQTTIIIGLIDQPFEAKQAGHIDCTLDFYPVHIKEFAAKVIQYNLNVSDKVYNLCIKATTRGTSLTNEEIEEIDKANKYEKENN